jgi:hypothetical protein
MREMEEAPKHQTMPELHEVLTRVYITISNADSDPEIYGVSTFQLGDGWMAVGAKRPALHEEPDEMTGTVKTSKDSAADAASQVVRELLELNGLGTRTRPVDIGDFRREEGDKE